MTTQPNLRRARFVLAIPKGAPAPGIFAKAPWYEGEDEYDPTPSIPIKIERHPDHGHITGATAHHNGVKHEFTLHSGHANEATDHQIVLHNGKEIGRLQHHAGGGASAHYHASGEVHHQDRAEDALHDMIHEHVTSMKPPKAQTPSAASAPSAPTATVAKATGGRRPTRLVVKASMRAAPVAKAFSVRTDEFGDAIRHYRPKKRLSMSVGPRASGRHSVPSHVDVHPTTPNAKTHRFTFEPSTDHGHDAAIHTVHHNGERIGRVSIGGHGAAARLDASQHTHRRADQDAMGVIHDMLHEHIHQHYAGEAKQDRML